MTTESIAMEGSDDELQDSNSLNTTILEYYNKFGKDRRLKKYLRLKEPTDAVGRQSNIYTQDGKDLDEIHPFVEVPLDVAESKETENVNQAAVSETTDTDSDKDKASTAQGGGTTQKIERWDKRLEWDSLGDVGYKHQQSQDESKTSSRRFDCNVLNLLSKDKQRQNCKETQISQQEALSSSTVKQKENWRTILENVKKKYDNQLLDTSEPSCSTLRFNSVSFSALSTPTTGTNKSVQTSAIEMECKNVQVSLSKKSASVTSSALSSSKSDSSFNTTEYKRISKNKNLAKPITDSSETSTSTTVTSSNVQPDLEMGVNLLCLLIESKNLSAKKKEKLIRRIVSKISGKNISSSNSSISTLFEKMKVASKSSSKVEGENINNFNKNSTKKLDVLLPQSNKENIKPVIAGKASCSSSEIDSISAKLSAEELAKTDIPKQKIGVAKHKNYVRSQSADDAQFMRSWLDPMTKSEVDYQNFKFVPNSSKKTKPFVPKPPLPCNTIRSKLVAIDHKAGGDFVPTGYRRSSEVFDFITNERISHLNWIESEIKHLDDLKQLLLKSNTNFVPTNRHQQVYGAILQNVYDKVASSSSKYCTSSTSGSLPVVYEKEILSEKETVDPNQLYVRSEVRREHETYDISNEQVGMQRKHSQSIGIQDEKKFPKRNYLRTEKHAEKQLRSKLKTPEISKNDNLADYVRNRKQQYIETQEKLYASKSAIDNSEENGHYSEPCEKFTSKRQISGSEACSSTSSPNFFISSGSISIPEVTSSTTTTTHQYDNRIGVAVQTTESLLDTGKIVEIHGKTKRPYRYGRNKQTQTKPQSIAYVISFGTRNTSGETTEITLREYLQTRRPDFTKRVDQRCVILDNLRKLRRERDKQMREIVENYSITTIPKKLRELPPPPTKYIRIFSTKEMKMMTKKKYSQLPEVLERNKKLKVDKHKKSNRIIAEVFNKRIQQRVRKGKLNLEQSMTVI